MMQFLNFSAEHPLLIAFFAFVIYCLAELFVNGVVRIFSLHEIRKMSDGDERKAAMDKWSDREKDISKTRVTANFRKED